MRIGKFNKNTITIIEADDGKYLVPKNIPEELNTIEMGKPIKVIYDNTGVVPEFEEREV